MGSRLGVQVVAGLGIAALFAVTALRTHTFALPDPGDFGKALFAVVVVAWFYDQFLWRWLQRLGSPPRLRGTWKMLLEPQEGPPETSLDEKPCYLKISQTASKINARILFADGESKATTTVLGKDRFGDDLLLLFYDFEPHTRGQGPPRKGAASLRIAQGALKGTYWNDIGISGDLTGSAWTRKMHKTYDAAQKGAYS